MIILKYLNRRFLAAFWVLLNSKATETYPKMLQYPGNVQNYAPILAYRRYFWRGLHAEYQLYPGYSIFHEKAIKRIPTVLPCLPNSGRDTVSISPSESFPFCSTFNGQWVSHFTKATNPKVFARLTNKTRFFTYSGQIFMWGCAFRG